MNHLASSLDFDPEWLRRIFNLALDFKSKGTATIWSGQSVPFLAFDFQEASTRTRVGFARAASQLGGSHVDISSMEEISIQKGESLVDSIKSISQIVNGVIVRSGDAKYLEPWLQHAQVPVINAGNGENEHPTQAILDLFCMHEFAGGLESLSVLLMGDVRRARVMHSLIAGLSLFPVTAYVACFEPTDLESYLHNKSHADFEIVQICDYREVFGSVDVAYICRLQENRRSGEAFDRENYPAIDPMLVSQKRERPILLHPFPRGRELPSNIDDYANAKYFLQMKNGLFVRAAILSTLICSEEIGSPSRTA